MLTKLSDFTSASSGANKTGIKYAKIGCGVYCYFGNTARNQGSRIPDFAFPYLAVRSHLLSI
jgi:hypothetical protein